MAWQNGQDARDLLPVDAPTLAAVLDAYGKRPNGAPIDRFQRGPILKTIVNGRPFGEWRAHEITREMIEAFRHKRPTVAGNRDLAVLRAMFNWAVLGELVPSTPFKVGTVSAVKLAREESRTRRLHAGEEEALLLHAKGSLRDLIVGAIETGMRLGELLSLQWAQVRDDLSLPAGKTKAKKARRVPISSVLRGVLDARRLDPAGEPLPPDSFVFGDEVGRKRGSIDRAWETVVLKAHSQVPVWRRSKTKNRSASLSPESRAHLNAIDLHFHDLRREAGSRWMDAGVPLSMIQRWLGHHNISQTSTYLAASGGGDADAMRKFEEAAGRIPAVDPLTDGQVRPDSQLRQIAPSAGSNGSEPTGSDISITEITQSNATVH